MAVFAAVDRWLRLVHLSDDGWMTRCGVRAHLPASASDVKKYGKCTRCAS